MPNSSMWILNDYGICLLQFSLICSLGYQCPITYNPTDFFIKVLALTPGSEGASRQAIKSVCDRFAVSDAAKELDMEIHLEFHLMDHEVEVKQLISTQMMDMNSLAFN